MTNIIPPPAPARGALETTSSSDGSFVGWAFDPNAPEAAIFVDVYLDGPAGSGAPAFRIVANGPRPDVNASFDIPGDHGYTFVLPAEYLGSRHTIYVYGVPTFGHPGTLLSRSPGTYNPPPPAPPPPRRPHWFKP